MELKRRVEQDTVSFYHHDKQVMWMRESLEEGDAVLVRLGGELVSEADHEFADEMAALLSANKRIVLDLSETTYLSAAFLHAFLNVQKAVDKRELPPLSLRNLSGAARQVFESEGYLELFDIEDEQ